jgi:hemoglobin
MTNQPPETPPYGTQDTSFQAAGGQEGLRNLVEDFYRHMGTQPTANKIFKMHSKDLVTVKDKLTLFLCGWLGGEKVYRPKYGKIIIPQAHEHLKVGPQERDAWMHCMKMAVAEQADWTQSFKDYFMREVYVPAERVRNQE